MKIMGIDPGNKGALAVIFCGEKRTSVLNMTDMPVLVTTGKGKTKSGKPKIHTVLNEPELRDFLEKSDVSHVFIEKCQTMKDQNVAAMGNYMCNYGIIRGICVGLRIPYTLVHPATWKHQMMKDMDKEKKAAVVRAKQLFPYITLKESEDGKADALLIAEYGRRYLL